MAAAEIPRVTASVVLPKTALQKIFENLQKAGFQLVGPALRDEAVVIGELDTVDDLPRGFGDEQKPGSYRLRQRNDGNWFAYTPGAHSWKQFLLPPRLALYSVKKDGKTWHLQRPKSTALHYAFIGVRACDLNAIFVQDRIFISETYRDPHYTRQREQMFVLAVNCSTASSSCFCASMKTGPKATSGFDLALTELPDAFLLEVGSEVGSEALRSTGWQLATAFDLGRAAQVLQSTQRQMQRSMRTDDLPQLLYRNLEHSRWDQVAARCLSCANCTLVCPTCFCTTVEDTSDLLGAAAGRTRVWDSCYVSDFSHVHGGNQRPTTRSRYRQWLTHKLASWMDQFGVLGCVGCGRCITWCPVGIDLTEEVAAIRETGAR